MNLTAHNSDALISSTELGTAGCHLWSSGKFLVVIMSALAGQEMVTCIVLLPAAPELKCQILT